MLENEKKLFIKDKKVNERRRILNYIAFIKFIAMINIIKWHVVRRRGKSPIDYGARMCEILFISSGFLVGYNHFQKKMLCDYVTSIQYSYKHLRVIYPLLFINTIYGYCFNHDKRYISLNSKSKIEILISNLLMIHNWSRYSKIASCFNGITWFLADLLLCYFLTPLLLQGIKNVKTSLILFIFTAFIRIISQELVRNGALNLFDAHFHRGPIIRLLEYYLGMLLIPSFFEFKTHFDKYKNRKWFKNLFTFIEISFPVFIYFIMLKFNDILYRCYYVIIFCSFIFIISYEYGFFSDIFSNIIIVKIMSCQMEMYQIQITINDLFNKIINKEAFEKLFHTEVQFAIKLFIIFICGYFIRILLRDKFSIFFDMVFNEFKKLFK